MSNVNRIYHDFGDKYYWINHTMYYDPLVAIIPDWKCLDTTIGEYVEPTPYCVCGWGDTSDYVETSLGKFVFCGRHGDPEEFARKYLNDMEILLRHKDQLKLELN